MGEDSLRPFLEYKDKWTIVLGLTSNKGARDFETQQLSLSAEILEEGVHFTKHSQKFLYEHVIESAIKWGTPDNLMFVVGATQASAFADIRRIAPDHFFLVPGVGAQGGNLQEISAAALIPECGLLVNASRAIIYASEDENFADEAAAIAQQYQYEMAGYLESV
jgi:orotidine-5'-phosphate decarboxylase